MPERIASYEIVGELGRGGFATVYRARDTRGGPDVALKVLRAGEGGLSPDDLRRFRREIEAAQAMDHPGIVRVLDASPDGMEPAWVAMELVEGEPLSARIAREPLPWREAVEIVRDVADAVAHAHARGILHRDLKPSNILLDREGRPHVVDFGLAKLVVHGSKLTKTGQALGTPAYMSPEQARGEVSALTSATDVWSLGCVLYETLAGRRPFEGETDAAVVVRVLLSEPPRLQVLRRDVPRWVERVVRAAMAKRVRDRYLDAGAMREDLDRVLRGERPRARPPVALQRKLLGAAAVACAIALPAGALAWPLGGEGNPGRHSPSSGPEDEAEVVIRRARAARPRDPRQSSELLGRALGLRPGERGLRHEKAECLREAGEWLAAEAEFGALLSEDPSDVRARLGRGLARWIGKQAHEEGLGDPVEDLRAAGEGLAGRAGGLARGILAFEARRWDEGCRELQEAAEGWEENFVRGLVRHHAGEGTPDDQAEAIRLFDRAVEVGPAVALVRYERGHAKELLGDLAGAIEDYGKALEVNPRLAGAWSNRGLARAARGDLAGAIEDSDRGLEVDPRHAEAWISRGVARAGRGEIAGAIEDYDKALAINPTLADAWHNRGLARAGRGDLAGAIDDFGRALEINSRHVEAWINRGLARRAKGDIAGAIEDHEKALEVAPPDSRDRAEVEKYLAESRSRLASK
ncbi:MAG: serine/threonine-protein kinase [Planctomycetales bacterium]|nr:serine/threonine-protein kinase [Planctomycetales bacterium]